MLTVRSRPLFTLDPLIAEARQRAHARQALIARLVVAAFIVGAALAGAAFLQHLSFVENTSAMLVLSFQIVRPWWLYAAMFALCLLGLAGAASVLTTAGRAVTSGYAAASALFVAAGVAALMATKLTVWIDETMVGRTNLAIALLLLGMVSALLAALTFRSRHRPPEELSVDQAG